jgi:N-acetylmuramic acid 6-phosphate etherase
MVDMRATNAKLRGRVIELLIQATGAAEDDCATALDLSGGELKVALVHLLSDGVATPRQAGDALATARGRVRDALAALDSGDAETRTLDATP